MTLRGMIEQRLAEYILREVDQRSNGVEEFFEYTIGGGSEFEGDWSDGRVIVTYRVPHEVDRRGRTRWEYRGTLEDLIDELDRMK